MKTPGVTVNVPLVEKDISGIVNSNKTGMFVANEWKRLISPYTPRRDGILEDTAKVRPFEIEYAVPYDFYLYHSENFNFYKEKNPFATDHWDMAAQNAGQVTKLVRATTKYLLR